MDRRTDKMTDKHTDKQSDSQTIGHIKTYAQMESLKDDRLTIDRQTDRQSDHWTFRQENRLTYGKTYTHTARQMDSQTDSWKTDTLLENKFADNKISKTFSA